MGRLNRRALLQRLQRLGTATRAELDTFLNSAEAAAGRLAELIQGGKQKRQGETHLFKPTLMLRGSTRPT